MHQNYRTNPRIPVHLFVNQYSGQEHWIGLSFNLSAGGLYLCQRPQPIPGVMGLELSLPGDQESIWTKAEVRFVQDHGKFMGVGLAFTAMADSHWGLLRYWVGTAGQRLRMARNERRSTMRQLLAC